MLEAAAPVGNTSEAARLLLDHGADVNARDRQGNTALLNAVNGLWPPLVELLLSRGACFNLGALYAVGDGVPKNTAMANTLYRKACTGGDAEACKELSASK